MNTYILINSTTYEFFIERKYGKFHVKGDNVMKFTQQGGGFFEECESINDVINILGLYLNSWFTLTICDYLPDDTPVNSSPSFNALFSEVDAVCDRGIKLKQAIAFLVC